MSSKIMNFHFIYINPEFDQQIADDFWNGEESEDNVKFLWEDEIAVHVVDDSFRITNRQVYTLKIQKEEEVVSFDIPNMTLISMESKEGEQITLGVSSKSIKKSEQKEKDGELHQYFYLKGADEPISPFAGLYVVPNDFPVIGTE